MDLGRILRVSGFDPERYAPGWNSFTLKWLRDQNKFQYLFDFDYHVILSFNQVRQALGEIPIVDDEIRRAAGTAAESASAAEDESAVKMSGSAPKQLVTADGTYASQSAFSAATPASRCMLGI